MVPLVARLGEVWQPNPDASSNWKCGPRSSNWKAV